MVLLDLPHSGQYLGRIVASAGFRPEVRHRTRRLRDGPGDGRERPGLVGAQARQQHDITTARRSSRSGSPTPWSPWRSCRRR